MKRAKLIIKGMKEPIFVSESDGLHARSIVEDSEISLSQVVRVGNWSGAKSEIRYVFFEEEKDYNEIDTSNFTDIEMDEFKKQISPFTIQRGDEEYEKRVDLFIDGVKSQKGTYMPPYMKDTVLALKEKHLQDDDLRIEAENYVNRNLVGKLTKKGELKFLESRKAIRVYDDGTFHILLDSNKRSSYPELSDKLYEYLKRNDGGNYVKQMDRRGLDILTQTMEVPEFIKNGTTQ